MDDLPETAANSTYDRSSLHDQVLNRKRGSIVREGYESLGKIKTPERQHRTGSDGHHRFERAIAPSSIKSTTAGRRKHLKS
jgi:hypothetical protein